MTKDKATLLAEYNTIREAQGKKALKSWKGSLAQLVETVAKAGVRIEKGAPAVAEGAYPTKREAEHRTGVKKKKVNGHKVAAAPKAAPTPKSRSIDSGEIHLSTIAKSINMSPRLARIKARAHKPEIRKLEVSGKKYVFPVGAKAKVLAILKPSKGVIK